jgi:hypothetical protein
MKLFIKPLLFLIVMPALYLMTIIAFSIVFYGDKQFLQIIIGNQRKTGGWGQTLQRFREIDNYQNIDILFVGSSHAYRGFDPRYFKEQGFSSFNIGSTCQTPLNSYYLLEKYFDKLHPKLIIIEVYPVVLSQDGLESFFDMVVNLPFSPEMARMAVALRNPQAVNALVAATFGRKSRPLDTYVQAKQDNERYISGGYCETVTPAKPVTPTIKPPRRISVLPIQEEYLERIIEFSATKGSSIVLVIQPLPKEQINELSNYREYSIRLNSLALRHKIGYIDFNDLLSLDFATFFLDDDHLNAAGVHQFNKALLDKINRGEIKLAASK